MKSLSHILRTLSLIVLSYSILTAVVLSGDVRKIDDFNQSWKFHLGDAPEAKAAGFDDSGWRTLDLPHDWSIEGEFNKDNPATTGGGALPGGIGWYRKSFAIPESDKEKLVFIEFDGVYRNSEVWMNGRYLGIRPYGYSSFRYELTPYLNYGSRPNIIAVKVDNSKQPNSRWYSGSGIYRNVRLVATGKIHVDHWGTFITTPDVHTDSAEVRIDTRIRNASGADRRVRLTTLIIDPSGMKCGEAVSETVIANDSGRSIGQTATVKNPALWSTKNPSLYTARTTVEYAGSVSDTYSTTFGIRSFGFDVADGFRLNGERMKILGVCNHHDLGCLGAAVNTRALERQLEILKKMGVNGIRTSHNPPAPELLDLCDRMGFIVMDEAFDMWKKKKTDFDYALDWDEWHARDIRDMVRRDRNHPSVFIWSIGNEVNEQWDRNDSSGTVIARELCHLIRELDTTRPLTSNLNDPYPPNPVIRVDALDLVGFSYHQNDFPDFPKTFPGKKFIGSETTSALQTRGSYLMPSDTVRRWPLRWDLPFDGGTPDKTCSSYDNCSAPWGSTHEETWKIIKKYDFLSGMYIWTGFDYLGEPTPYSWPARSSYFGIVDLAGFPKDAFYMYQSEWTDTPVLHVFPHWNWQKGDTVDVWAYTNCMNVELFLNGKSLGTRMTSGDALHLEWKAVPFEPGVVKAVGHRPGKADLISEVRTAGPAVKIALEADRSQISADGRDLSFITVKILDENGTLVPDANNLIHFDVAGEGKIAGVDNGLQTSLEPFKANYRKAFNGLCLAVIQSAGKPGRITVAAKSAGLAGSSLVIETK